MLGTKVTLSVSAWLSEKCKNRCISAIWPISVPLFESGSAPSSVDHSIHEAASDDLWLKLVIAINVSDIVGTTAVVNMRLQSLDPDLHLHHPIAEAIFKLFRCQSRFHLTNTFGVSICNRDIEQMFPVAFE